MIKIYENIIFTAICFCFRDTGHLTPAQRRHNTILSRTRVVIENTFGLCKERWRILKYINTRTIKRAILITNACCVLHNFCLLDFDDSTSFTFEEDMDDLSAPMNVDKDEGGVQKREMIAENL